MGHRPAQGVPVVVAGDTAQDISCPDISELVNGSGSLFHMTTLRHALGPLRQVGSKADPIRYAIYQRRVRPILDSSFAIQFFECTRQVFQRTALLYVASNPTWAPPVEKCNVNMLGVDCHPDRGGSCLTRAENNPKLHAPTQLDVLGGSHARDLLFRLRAADTPQIASYRTVVKNSDFILDSSCTPCLHNHASNQLVCRFPFPLLHKH